MPKRACRGFSQIETDLLKKNLQKSARLVRGSASLPTAKTISMNFEVHS